MDRNAYISALAELSHLREKPDASEAECQAWFERHQSLVFPCLNYRRAIPHRLLETDGGTGNYIPDFITKA